MLGSKAAYTNGAPGTAWQAHIVSHQGLVRAWHSEECDVVDLAPHRVQGLTGRRATESAGRKRDGSRRRSSSKCCWCGRCLRALELRKEWCVLGRGGCGILVLSAVSMVGLLLFPQHRIARPTPAMCNNLTYGLCEGFTKERLAYGAPPGTAPPCASSAEHQFPALPHPTESAARS